MSLIEELIKIEPSIATALTQLFSAGNPSPADWLALRAKVLGQDFSSLAPNAAANLPPSPPTNPTPAPETASQTTAKGSGVETVAPVTPPVVDAATAPAPALAVHPIFGTPITPVSP